MAEIIRTLEKENPDVSHVGKFGSARKNVLGNVTNKTKAIGSVTKKPKALMDVKNTVYLRKNTSSELNTKKQFVSGETCQYNSEKFTKNELASDSHNVKKNIVVPTIKITSDTTDLEEEIISLPVPSKVTESDDDFDIEDCPTCFENDDDDWLANVGPQKYSDDDIFNICCNPVPCKSPSSEMNIDDWFKSQYEPMSPLCTKNLTKECRSYIPEFQLLPEIFLHCFDDIAPVGHED